MPDEVSIELTNGPQIQRVLDRIGQDLADGSTVLKQLDRVTKADMAREMNNAKATGGTVRGKTWEGFADQYTRKTDGVTVPAWGGVPRVDGNGTVKGRKRPSGQRVKRTSKVNLDTGAFMAAVVGSLVQISNSGKLLIIGGRNILPRYAKYILAKRPLFFWTRKDRNNYRRLAIDHIRTVLKRAEKDAGK